MAATPTPAAPAKKPGLLINHNYALLWAGQGISVIGDQVFNTTLVVWIGAVLTAHLAFSALALSGVLVAAALPSLLVAPVAGVLVDRWDRRRTMLAMDFLRALLIAALLPASGVVPWPFWQTSQLSLELRLGIIYSVVFLASTCAQFFNPARLSLIADIVDEPVHARASGLAQSSQSFAAIIGPPLAAPLLFGLGIEWALVIDALSFLASFLTILAIHLPVAAGQARSGRRERLGHDLLEGVAFTFRNHVLLTILVACALVVLGAGALNALLFYFVTQNLHASSGLYGFVGTAEGVGALAGAVLASIFAQRLGVARMYAWSIVSAAALLLVAARMTMFLPALIVIALVGVAEAAMNVALTPLILRLVPRQLLGRVVSLMNPLIVTAGLVGTALAGYFDSEVLRGFRFAIFTVAFGPVDTIFVAAGVIILLGGIYAVSTLSGEEIGVGPAAPVAASSRHG